MRTMFPKCRPRESIFESKPPVKIPFPHNIAKPTREHRACGFQNLNCFAFQGIFQVIVVVVVVVDVVVVVLIIT